MEEFKSKLEEIMPAKELKFPPTPAFGAYKQYLEQAISHPAKANTKLLEYLIKNFTKEGDTILDPMAGSGSTGIVAALHKRNAIQVEIEQKFYKWMEEAREKVEKAVTLTPKGGIVNICGDARRLSELLGAQLDVAITSPPYGLSISSKQHGRDPKPWISGRVMNEINRGYSESEDNIGNLPLGSIDTIITSPPYLKSADHGAGVNKQRNGDVKIGCSTVGRTVENEDAIDNAREYGNIDAIITSPPYGDTNDRKGRKMDSTRGIKNRALDLPENPENIGNMDKETYLEAMFKVYREMWKVLKPNGLAIIIIKPFIRNKRVIDLPYHTWLLLEKAGFKLIQLFKLRLKQESFWRILYKKKYPNVPKIKHEYILITQKCAS